jgi:hypothetical protein
MQSMPLYPIFMIAHGKWKNKCNLTIDQLTNRLSSFETTHDGGKQLTDNRLSVDYLSRKGKSNREGQ